MRAPFAGLVEETQVEIGDFVQPGTACATIIDLDPMLLVGRVAERDVHKLKLGTTAMGTLIDGTQVSGSLTFIGQQSDTATRTYPVEIQVPNPAYKLRSGVTTQIAIPIETVMAHRISPALLALDDEGRVGVRTLDSDNRVVFNLVKVLNDDGGSVWISGSARNRNAHHRGAGTGGAPTTGRRCIRGRTRSPRCNARRDNRSRSCGRTTRRSARERGACGRVSKRVLIRQIDSRLSALV